MKQRAPYTLSSSCRVNAGNAAIPPKNHNGDDDAEKGKPRATPSISDISSVCKAEEVPSLLCIKFCTGLCGELFQTTLPLALKDEFQLSVAESGTVMSALGLLSMIGVHQAFRGHAYSIDLTQCCHFSVSRRTEVATRTAVHGLLIKWLVKTFSDARIVLASCWILLLSFVALTFHHSFIPYLGLLVPIYAASYVFSIVNTTQLTKAVPAEQLGSILAMDMALGSVTRMVSPLAGTSLLRTHGLAGVGISSSLSVALALLFAQLSVAKAKMDGFRKDS